MVQQIQNDVSLAHDLDFPKFCNAILDQGRLSFFNQATVLLGLGRGWEVAKAGIPKVDDNLLSSAKDNLARIDYIGFTERYSESFSGLGFLSKEPSHLNASEEITMSYGQSFYSFLKEATKFDEQLYEYALEKVAIENLNKTKFKLADFFNI